MGGMFRLIAEFGHQRRTNRLNQRNFVGGQLVAPCLNAILSRGGVQAGMNTSPVAATPWLPVK